MTNPTNTQIRDRLNRAKNEPITAGVALELMPLLETVLRKLESVHHAIHHADTYGNGNIPTLSLKILLKDKNNE